MSKPLVSIIIPVYNSEKHLAATVASALTQTWPNIEIIIVDDGSSDNSLALAKSYASDNIKVFHQENKGASSARNKGLSEAKGDYIQFLDADDLLSPDKIAEQVTVLEKNPGKLAACNTIHFNTDSDPNNGKPTRYEDTFLFDDDNPAHFLINLLGGFQERGSMIALHSWLTPRGIVEKAGLFNEEITTDDDGEFFCRVILNSKGILKTKGISYYRKYVEDRNSLSSQLSKRAIESSFKSVLSKKKHLFAHNDSEPAHLAIYKQLLTLAVGSYLAYPDLYQQINNELKQYPPYKVKMVLGGKAINKIAQRFWVENGPIVTALYQESPMIAVVSSTIKPLSKNEQAVSFYSFDERLQQTFFTLSRLQECGFDKIFLVDNSPGLDRVQLQNIFQDFPNVELFHLEQYQFANKGITELLMLLYLVEHLPVDEQVFKISGRYYPSNDFKKPDFIDIAAKGYNYNGHLGTISTRAYWIKNSETFQRFLLNCMNELFAYPERIVGIGSFFRVLLKRKNAPHLNISIEFAAANILKSGNYKVTLLDNISIEGLIAGTDTHEKITE